MIVDNNWATTAVNANFRAVEDSLDFQRVADRSRANVEAMVAEYPEVEKLARRMAIEYRHDPDSLIYRGMPEVVHLPSGYYYRATSDRFPIWRAFVYPAWLAVTVVDEREKPKRRKPKKPKRPL